MIGILQEADCIADEGLGRLYADLCIEGRMECSRTL